MSSKSNAPPPQPHATVQIAANTGVLAEAVQRESALVRNLAVQDRALTDALAEINKAREFIESGVKLGNKLTQHGEIAEHIQVRVHNARRLVQGLKPDAVIDSKDGILRNGPVDYRIGIAEVQSKFINGARNNLDHVMQHMAKYEGFAVNSNNYYHIPRDHYETIIKAINGEPVEGLKASTLETLRRKAEEISLQAGGRPFEEVVRPGISKYAEVIRGNVRETLNTHDVDLTERSEAIKGELTKEAEKLSVKGAANAAVVGGVVGAGIGAASELYTIWKTEGRTPLELSADDLERVFGSGLKAGAMGSVSAAAVYLITKSTALAAPLAATVVSSAIGLGSLALRYREGDIDLDDFADMGMMICYEGAVVGAATMLGQALIPIPAVGALVGAVAGRLMTSIVRDWLQADSKALDEALRARFDNYVSGLDEALRASLDQLLEHFDRLGSLTQAAFDIDRNVELRLLASVRLAQAYGVAEDEILHNETDLDTFMNH